MTPASTEGLSSVPQLSAILDAERPTPLRFPGTELVEAAASLFQSGPRWRGSEGRRFRVEISAGTVGVSMCDPARLERNSLNALLHDTLGTRELLAPPSLTDVDGVRFSQVHVPADCREDDEWRERAPVRQVEGWSRKSRARMVRRLAQLDWSPLYDGGRPGVLGTLTYPGDWLTVAPTGAAVKRHWLALCKRYERRWGAPLVCAWKLEFQRRGAPHLHFLFVPPADPLFRAWLSDTWAAVVAHPDPEQRRRHALAGTGLDYLKGGRCIDPKRAAVYFAKHGGAAGGKEYQHAVPEQWQEAGAGPGRFWGYRGLRPVVASVDVTAAEYVLLRRTLRRWSQAQGLTRTRRVPRGADPVTGEVRYRAVTRRARYVGQGGLAGGTLLVNDGPAFASQLSRLVTGR